jgi:hypothetical protein
MSKRSFLERVNAGRPSSRIIAWPFPSPLNIGEEPKVRVKVLGKNVLEEAYFAVLLHFSGRKPKVTYLDPAFVQRERTELVFRAFEDAETGLPIAASVDALADEPAEVLDVLYEEWRSVQRDATGAAPAQDDIDALVEHLKKNIQGVPLEGLASCCLIALVRTMADQLANSPTTRSGS